MNYLDLEDLLQVAERTLRGEHGIRDIGLLESALARPQASAFGADAYPTVRQKAAALLHSLAKNHALMDGNKRLAVMATVVFLRYNGERLLLADDELFELVLAVATGALDGVEEIAAQLQSGIAPTL